MYLRKEGYLLKIGGLISPKWQPRYFILKNEFLYYYSNEQANSQDVKGNIHLVSWLKCERDLAAKARNVIYNGTLQEFIFSIKGVYNAMDVLENERNYVLAAQSEIEMEDWIKSINHNATVIKNNKNKPQVRVIQLQPQLQTVPIQTVVRQPQTTVIQPPQVTYNPVTQQSYLPKAPAYYTINPSAGPIIIINQGAPKNPGTPTVKYVIPKQANNKNNQGQTYVIIPQNNANVVQYSSPVSMPPPSYIQQPQNNYNQIIQANPFAQQPQNPNPNPYNQPQNPFLPEQPNSPNAVYYPPIRNSDDPPSYNDAVPLLGNKKF